MSYMVYDKNGNVYYEALTLAEAQVNCPKGGYIKAFWWRYYPKHDIKLLIYYSK